MSLWDNILNWFKSGWNGIIDWVIELLNSFGTGLGSFINSWFDSLGLSLEIPSGVFKVLNEITYGIGYILPLSSLTPLFLFWLSFHFAHLIFALFRLLHSTIFKRVSVKM